MKEYENVIIGGGMVGSALGYGLAKAGRQVLVLDKGDRDLRAARGNFGLLWVQGKGADYPEYADWTLRSTQLWPEFAKELLELTGIDVQFRQRGGIHYCLDEEELQQYGEELSQQATVTKGAFQYQMLDSSELSELEPAISKDIPGGGYSPNDGHVNPLLLLRAMQRGLQLAGGLYQAEQPVTEVEPKQDGFLIRTESGVIKCQRLILAAGFDNARLAPMVGLAQPLHPQRGQLLITERLPTLLNYPSIYLRQTGEGTIQIGDSAENSGFDDTNTAAVMAALAQRAIRLLPALGQSRIVRGWGALRVLTPDGYPVYEQTTGALPEAFAFSCHSAVTLAAAHAQILPDLILSSSTDLLSAFSAKRFTEAGYVQTNSGAH